MEFFNLIPKDNGFLHYEGSLTTPSCAEIVNWYMNKDPIRARSKCSLTLPLSPADYNTCLTTNLNKAVEHFL